VTAGGAAGIIDDRGRFGGQEALPRLSRVLAKLDRAGAFVASDHVEPLQRPVEACFFKLVRQHGLRSRHGSVADGQGVDTLLGHQG
jgi:hypothetical protein